MALRRPWKREGRSARNTTVPGGYKKCGAELDTSNHIRGRSPSPGFALFELSLEPLAETARGWRQDGDAFPATPTAADVTREIERRGFDPGSACSWGSDGSEFRVWVYMARPGDADETPAHRFLACVDVNRGEDWGALPALPDLLAFLSQAAPIADLADRK